MGDMPVWRSFPTCSDAPPLQWYGSGARAVREAVGARCRAGELVHVLPAWKIATVDVNGVYPSNRNITARVRGFVSVLARRFEGDPDFM